MSSFNANKEEKQNFIQKIGSSRKMQQRLGIIIRWIIAIVLMIFAILSRQMDRSLDWSPPRYSWGDHPGCRTSHASSGGPRCAAVGQAVFRGEKPARLPSQLPCPRDDNTEF